MAGVSELGACLQRIVSPKPIVTERVKKVVSVTHWSSHRSQCAGDEADAIHEVEQVCQRACGGDQRRIPFEPDESARAEQRTGDAECARARTYVDDGSNSEVLQPVRRPFHYNQQRRPVFRRDKPERLGQEAIERAIVGAASGAHRLGQVLRCTFPRRGVNRSCLGLETDALCGMSSVGLTIDSGFVHAGDVRR